MDMLDHIRLLAHYNQEMNINLYKAASTLPEEEIKRDVNAYFSSILGTLNHLLVGDILWLRRLAEHPVRHVSLNPIRATEAPVSLDQKLFNNLNLLWNERQIVDAAIVNWCAELTEQDLEHPLEYHSMAGKAARKNTGSLILNLFNHHTHHRGQVTTLLSQQGVDVGVTDLLVFIPES